MPLTDLLLLCMSELYLLKIQYRIVSLLFRKILSKIRTIFNMSKINIIDIPIVDIDSNGVFKYILIKVFEISNRFIYISTRFPIRPRIN